VPLTGFVVTYLLVAGWSLGNVDVRAQAEVVGLVLLAAFVALGVVLTRHAGNPAVGVAVNHFLAALVVALAVTAVAARRAAARPANHVESPVIAVPAQRPRRIWIDTDLACGAGKTSDVDDCWALALALRSPEIEVRGISTVFGNRLADDTRGNGKRADIAREILALTDRAAPVFAGSERAADTYTRSTPASAAMAAALGREPLTIVALGPSANVAALLAQHPELAPNIERIVMIAGKSPGQLFHPGKHWWFHFGDFNVAQDVAAVRTVLQAGVPITLVPFDLAMQVEVGGTDLERLHDSSRLARWLATESQGWLAFWQGELMQKRGFAPFDALAIGLVARPDLFGCADLRARIGFSVFLAPFGLGRDLEVGASKRGWPVRYCRTVDPRFKALMIERLEAETSSR
jgi:pyrimidine-specific ribonucleoside hydrolase